MKKFSSREQLINVSIGLTIFGLGLFKKTVLADGAAQHASYIFDAASDGTTLTFFEAWGGALAYTFQLYFDFSGYSDMAIGAARLFGIRLPLNFQSPYKSTSITEFWRRWHMSLSRFLRDYVYIPLGGSRKGNIRRYSNLMTTMLLGGLWHGAGWTFVVWGGLHGCYLIINHAWDKFCRTFIPAFREKLSWRILAWLITFVAVVVGWVFFRAANFTSAIAILEGMFGMNGVSLPNNIVMRLGAFGEFLGTIGVTTYLGGGNKFVATYLWIIVLFPIALIMPNTQEFMRKFEPALKVYESNAMNSIQLFSRWTNKIVWQPSIFWSGVISVVFVLGILALTNISEFLYFQF